MRNPLLFRAALLASCLTLSAHAQQVWVKSPHNPIVPAQNGYSAEPAVIFDASDNKYKMWYSAFHNGVYHIFYAFSTDGIAWTNYSNNPVLSPGSVGAWDSFSVRSSAVIQKNGEYYFYYFGTGVLSGNHIGLAKSLDGINWVKFQGNPILSPSAPGAWDDNTVYHPKVVFNGAKFLMWYAGSNGNLVQGGLATSNDGQSWTKHSSNPVLKPSASNSWDEYRIWPSSGVVFKDGKFVLLYTGVNFSNAENSPIGLATSSDGIVWEKDLNNPILLAGGSGAWDDDGLGNGSLLFDGERFKLWYGAHNANGVWRIGYAESGASAVDFALQFDGLDDLVQINDVNGSLDLDDFTLEAWVYRMEENKTEEIIHKGGVGENPSVNTNYAILFREDNLARAHFEYADSRNVEAVGTTPIQTNRWYHIAGVRSSADNSLKVYVNGVLDAPPLKTELPPNQQNSPVRLGANDPGWNIDENFKGILDEVRIWKIARTQEQIQATMHTQLSGQEQGLAAYWRLNEGSGQAAHDRTSLGNHGMLGLSFNVEAQDPIWVKPPALPPDSSNFALDFDGVNDHVLFEPNLLDTPQQITMEAWVKYQSTKTHMMAVSLEGVYAFFLNRFGTGTFTPFFDGGSIHANDHAYGANLNDGQWHHLAAVNNGQTLQTFIDGVFMGSVNETLYDITSLNRTSAIGAQFDASEFHFDGVVDEVRVWKFARTPEQIQANMHERLSGNEAGLVAYWRMDEGAGQVINDGATPPHPGHRGSSENADAADPTWVLANRTPATGCLGIPLPAGEAYGNINQNRQTHMDKITYCFDGPSGDRYLSFAAYDIDQRDEVSVSLNGETLMFAPITANNTWSSLVGVLLSDAQIHDGQPNTLVFDNTRNPPQTWRYGVRQVSVDPFYALPSPAAYGNITGGDTEHGDKVVYFFSGRGGDLNLAYQVFDIDHLDEVDIVLNDTKIKDETLTSDEAWSETRTLLLPDELVHNTGVNVLIFENTKNPPRNWRWGVRNVSVNAVATSSLALAGQTNASVNGQGVLNGRYLIDGQLAPPLREHGDPAADTSHYVIQGATTIAANGHALIELPSAQKIDYLTLYPEWHAARYFSYRVETSSDGGNWSAAIDRMNVKLRGPQTERIAKNNVRYLRLTGVSFVVDPDSSLLNGLSESAYWQSYTSLLQQAQPEALAIAELVLLKQEGNVQVDEPALEVPKQYHLAQNLPNPFNPSTIIRFDLPQAERVFLAVYNLRGELVATLVEGNLAPGSHAFTFEGRGLASGVYFYRVTTEKFVATKKMLLTK